jgi:poly(3-hydroxybutyrate) depolymerase
VSLRPLLPRAGVMVRAFAVAGALALVGSAPAAASSPCAIDEAAPWIHRWFDAWELTSRQILRLPDAPPPHLVFFDSLCVYTTSERSAKDELGQQGPALLGTPLPWRATTHGDFLTLPTGDRHPVQLLSFAGGDKAAGPFFVMAAPSYWAQKGIVDTLGMTPVFLHEFAHTRQTRGVGAVLGPMDSTWSRDIDLSDDVLQHLYRDDSTYVAAWQAENDLFYRAATAATDEDARALAREGLAAMRARHARWFTGANADLASVDDLFLSMEGTGQMTAVLWLSHREGGRMERAAAVERMRGRRRWWSQEEGLGIFLVLDRLLPEWPSLVFGETSAGALELLERAIDARGVETGFLDRTIRQGDVDRAYQVYVPRGYTPDRDWPVILFLHGGGETGHDGLRPTAVGLGAALRWNPERFPAIVVFPQLAPGRRWNGDEALLALGALEATEREFATDPERVYLTGLSRGGAGAWYIARREPDRFAAVLVACGRVTPPDSLDGRPSPDADPIVSRSEPDPFGVLAETLGRLPTWIVHGDRDPVIAVEESRRLVAALRERGAPVRYTELPGVGHGAWEEAYGNPGISTWLFEQRRRAR